MNSLQARLKVLFIDDEPLHLDLLKRILQVVDPGLEVDIISDPTKAIEKILKNSYDCVILDEKMPVIAGHDIIKMIKQVKDIPCIIYTGYDETEIEAKATESGADGFLGKLQNANYYPKLSNAIRQTVASHQYPVH